MTTIKIPLNGFIAIAILGFLFIEISSALQCYQCTTSDEGCEDVDHQNFPSYNLTCNDTQFDHPVRGEVNVTNTMCMSIRTVPRRKKEGDVEPVLDPTSAVITRQCASSSEEGCEETFTGYAVQTTCYCSGDLCNNDAHTISYGMFLTVAMVAIGMTV